MANVSVSGGSLTYEEAATELNVHVETIRREVKRGRLEAYRVGLRGVRISRDALDRYRTANVLTIAKG